MKMSFNDYEDKYEQLLREMKNLQTQLLIYQKDKSNAAQMQICYKKVGSLLAVANQTANLLKGNEKIKASIQMKNLQLEYKSVSDKITNLTNMIELPNQFQNTANQMQTAVNSTQDTKRMAQETIAISNNIKESILAQNDQMKRIGYTANNIGGNTAKADKLVQEMYKREKIVNIILIGVNVVLVASWILAFCIFHHII